MRKIISYTIIFLIVLSSSSGYATSYRVAGDSQFPPYEYIDHDGIFKGFNVDLLKAIGLVSEIEFIFLPMKWEDTYKSIEEEKADIIQGMKESSERKEKFSFSNSLFTNSQSIFVDGQNNNIKDMKGLEGRKIALNKEDIIYEEIKTIKDVDIRLYDTLEEALDSLLNKRVDALIGNTLTVNYLCKEKGVIESIKIVGETINEQKYGIAVAKGNEELLVKINKGLAELQKNGMYDSLYRKWFGSPIKNTKSQSEMLWKITLIACGILIAVNIFIQMINSKLKKIVAEKTEEHKELISELRHYDKLHFMDKIISSIAHEIRNPLTSIKIYTKQIQKKLDNKDFLMAAAEDIPVEIDRIDGLIEEFMEYTSPKKPNIERVNLYSIVMASIKLVQFQIKSINLIIDIDESLYVEFDKLQFKQLILNILLNSGDALKGQAKPEIKIYTREYEKQISLVFEDNGYGMKEEDIQYIFEPFFTTKEFGNGLGMFVVKQIVDENLGDLSVSSEGPNKGMTIKLNLSKGELNEE